MATFVPSLTESQTIFGMDTYSLDYWSKLISKFPDLNLCWIYHRIDVSHKEFLDYPAYLSAFEILVCHPSRGVVAVIDKEHRRRSGISPAACNEFYKNFIHELQEWEDCSLEPSFADKRLNQDALEVAIIKLKENTPKNIPKQIFQKLIQYLNNHFGAIALPPNKLSDFDNFLDTRFKRITQKTRIFQDINNCYTSRIKNKTPFRVHIDGTAGCGKTLAALHLYKKLASHNIRPLLLCFNNLLGRRLENECSDHYGFANTVYSLAHKTLIAHGIPPDKDTADHLQILGMLLQDKKLLLNESERFDALIVDEGQGFREDWMPVIKHFLRKNHDVAWFEDTQQDIATRNNRVDLEKNFPGIIPEKRIRQNLRNPNRIIRHTFNLLGRISSSFGGNNPCDSDQYKPNMTGISPRNHSCTDKNDLIQKVENRVTDLKNQGLDINQIKIISCRNTDKNEPSIFLDCDYEVDLKGQKTPIYRLKKLKKYDLQRYMGYERTRSEVRHNTDTIFENKWSKIYEPKSGIPCDSVFKIKGLEYTAVILVDIEQPENVPVDQWLRRLYCGLTRATYSLDVFYLEGHWQGNEKDIFNFKLA